MAAQQDEDFAAMFEATPKAPGSRGARRVKPGQLVEGTIVEIGADNVFVDIGAKSEARIERTQLIDKQGNLKVAIGDKVRATVASANHAGVVLIVQFGRGGIDVHGLELARDSGVPVEGTVSKAVKAGLEIDIGGVRAFCPASQLDLGFVQDLEIFVGQKHFFKVLEIRDSGRSVVVSRKAVLKDERENQAKVVRERLTVGLELDGIVQSIQPYGAFIDLGGLEGLVHVSELGHGRVDRVEDVIKVGEAVRVRVIAIDTKGTGNDLKISLSMKAATQNENADRGPETDTVLAGKVAEVTNFGVLVDTDQGRGLVSINELGLPQGADPKRTFTPGKDVEVVVMGRDNKNNRLRLSIRGVAAAEERTNYKTFAKENKKASGGGKGLGTFGDLLGNAGIDAKLPPGPPQARSAANSAATRPGNNANNANAAQANRGDDASRRRRV